MCTCFSGEFRRLRRRLPDQPEDSHTLKVAIIGAPNAGKSTLTNSLAGWKVNSSATISVYRRNPIFAQWAFQVTMISYSQPRIEADDEQAIGTQVLQEVNHFQPLGKSLAKCSRLKMIILLLASWGTYLAISASI